MYNYLKIYKYIIVGGKYAYMKQTARQKEEEMIDIVVLDKRERNLSASLLENQRVI